VFDVCFVENLIAFKEMTITKCCYIDIRFVRILKK
jgi:hypothetical protein